MASVHVRTRWQERQFQMRHMHREQRLQQLQHRRTQLNREHHNYAHTNNCEDAYVAWVNRPHTIEWWIGYSKSRGIIRKSVANHIAKGLEHHSINKDEQDTTNMSNTDSVVSSATRGIHFQTTEDRTYRKISQEHENRHVAAHSAYVQKIRATASSYRNGELSEDLKQAIRGKTAGQISLAILAESEKNLQESKKLDQLLIESDRIQRNLVGGTKIKYRVQHVDLQDQQRSIEQLSTTVGASLHNVKQQLQSMGQHALDISQNSRFRRNYSPKIALYR